MKLECGIAKSNDEMWNKHKMRKLNFGGDITPYFSPGAHSLNSSVLRKFNIPCYWWKWDNLYDVRNKIKGSRGRDTSDLDRLRIRLIANEPAERRRQAGEVAENSAARGNAVGRKILVRASKSVTSCNVDSPETSVGANYNDWTLKTY